LRQLILAAALLAPRAAAQRPGVAEPFSPDPFGAGAPAPSEQGAGHGTWAFRLSYYEHDDAADASSGNPFLDEDLEVIEPVVYFDYDVSDETTYWGMLAYDWVSSASIDRLSKFPQQSGASGDYFVGVQLGLNHKLDPRRTVGGFFSSSVEYDYLSFGLGGNLGVDLAEGDARVETSVNGYYDTLDVIRYNGVDEGTDERISLGGNVNWYQVLGPRTHSTLGLNLNLQYGFLETPYNEVVVEDPAAPPNPNLPGNFPGFEFTEELPDDRARLALYGRVRHLLTERFAAEVGARIYGDDWGILAWTLEPQLHAWIVREKLKTRLRYRYYDQTEADFYEEHFTTLPSERTQDSDLGAFDAHTLGVRFDVYGPGEWSWDFGFDVTDRSDDLDQLFASFGLSRRF
jgi:hypothetical protein